jgi:hypothetical protein
MSRYYGAIVGHNPRWQSLVFEMLNVLLKLQLRLLVVIHRYRG